MSRRLNFLHYLFNEGGTSLVRRFLQAQRECSGKGDWITMVAKDIRELEINLTLEEVEVVSKAGWKELVSKKVQKKAFEYLSELKTKHSKAKNIIHHKLQLQSYLGSSNSRETVYLCRQDQND